jgi:hypothetical protein
MGTFYGGTPSSATLLMCMRVMADYDRRITVAGADAEPCTNEIYIFCPPQVCYIA